MAGDGAAGVPKARAWVLASRPKTLFAAVAPVLMGGGLAAAEGRFAVLPFLAAFACAVLIQVAANLANDLSDHLRGADAPDRAGPARVAASGLLSARELRLGIAAVYGLGLVPAAYLVAVAGWPVVAVALSAMVAALAYTGGPWPFGYHGLGDAFVLVFFGPVAVGGTYYVQTLSLAPDLLVAGLGIGALITAILVVNNLRDISTDARAGKRTLAVRLGPGPTRGEYVALLAAGFLAPPAGVWLLSWSPGVLATLAALPVAARPLGAVLRAADPRELNAALAGTARLCGAYGLLFAAGVLW